MERFEWFPLYLKALTETDPQRRVLAIDSTLSTLVERYECLQRDPSEEREFLLRAIAQLRDLRKAIGAGEKFESSESSVSTLDSLRLAEGLRKRTAE